MASVPSRRLASRLLAEMAVIVAGVLIALWVDGAAEHRSKRQAEVAILERVRTEIEDNRRLLNAVLANLDEKEASLTRVEEGFRRPAAIPDTVGFFRDVLRAGNYGYGQPRPPRAAYDDVVGSGRLELIQDDELRTMIVAYYWSQMDNDERMSHRLTSFAPTAHGLLEIEALNSARERNSFPNQDRIMADLISSRLAAEVVGERNRVWLLRDRLSAMVADAEALAEALESELARR